jgi:hypothetical protein
MAPVVIIILAEAATEGNCSVCGQATGQPAGPRLAVAESFALLCDDCGRKHAPALWALLDLANLAKRVGRIGCHVRTSFPLGAILDLLSVSEKYYSLQTADKGRT